MSDARTAVLPSKIPRIVERLVAWNFVARGIQQTNVAFNDIKMGRQLSER
jgi:hypothetical protein